MSTTIDQKVVEMRFDNGQFERGVSESISSLDQLKSSLNFSDVTKGLDTLGTSVSSISSKLSPFGEAWRRIWSNAADVVWASVSSVKSAVDSLTTGQIGAGFEKYSMLTKSVQTIMAATRQEWADQGKQMGYISSQMEKLNWFTDETSYSFGDMASNISKFTSASIPLDTAVTSMMGIATWAGISGAGIQEASRAMYNLSQAIAMGYVSIRDWMSVENANMATKEFKQTVIDTAVAIGTLERDADGFTYVWHKTTDGWAKWAVTADNFRATLNSDYGNWFNTEVLNTALQQYGDFTEKLYIEVNRTKKNATELLSLTKDYKEVLKDVNDTAEKIGEEDVEVVEDLIQQYFRGTIDLEAAAENYGLTVDELAEHFEKYKGSLLDYNEIKKMTDGTVMGTIQLQSALDKLSGSEYELGMTALLASQESRTLQDVLVGIQDAVSSTWMRIFVVTLGDYLEAVDLWGQVYDELWDLLVADIDNTYWIIKEWGDLGGREVLLEAISNAWYAVKDVITAVKDEMHSIFPEMTGERLLEITEIIRDFTAELKLGDLELLQIRATIQFIGKIIKNVWYNISTVFNSIKDAFVEIFPKTKTFIQLIYEFARGSKNLSEKLKITDSQADKLKRTFKGVFAVFDILGQLISAILKPLFGKLSTGMDNVGDSVLDMTAGFGDWLVALDKTIRETDVFGKAIESIKAFFQQIIDVHDELVKALTGKDLKTIWEEIKINAKSSGESIKKFFGIVNSGEDNEKGFTIANFFETVSQALKDFKEALNQAQPYIDEINKTLGETFDVEWTDWDEFTKRFREGSALTIAIMFLYELYNLFRYLFVDTPLLIKNIADSWSLFYESIADGVWALTQKVKISSLVFVTKAILNLAIAMALIASIKTERLNQAVVTLIGLIGAVFAIMQGLDKSTRGIDKALMAAVAGAISSVGLAILELAVALAIVAKVAESGGDIEGAADALGNMLIAIAAALFILSKVKIDPKGVRSIALAFGIIGFALIEIAAALAIVMTVAGKSGNIIESTIALVAMILAVGMLYKAMSATDIKPSKIIAASASMAVIGFALIEVAAALSIVMAVAKKTGTLWDSVEALGIMLGIISAFFYVLSNKQMDPGKILVASIALTIVGYAIIELAAAIAIVAGVAKDDSFTDGFESLIGLLIAVVAALIMLTKLSKDSGSLFVASTALVVASVGVIALAYALNMLKDVDLDAVLVMGVALMVLIGAAILAEKVIYGLLALGGAMILIGLGALAAGTGMLRFAEGIEKLVAAGKDGVDVLIYFLGELGGVLPAFFASLGEGLTRFLTVAFVDNSSIILEALGNLFYIILRAFEMILPVLWEVLKQLFYGARDLIIDMTPVLIDLVLFITRELLKAMVSITPDITKAALDILLDTLRQINDNIGEVTYLATSILLEITFGLIKAINEHIPDFIAALMDSIIYFIEGLALAIEQQSEPLMEAVEHLIYAIIDVVCKILGINSPSKEFMDIGFNIIEGFLKGLSDNLFKIVDFLRNFCTMVVAKVTEVISPMVEKGREILNAIEAGMRVVFNNPLGLLKALMNAAMNAISEFLEPIKEKAILLIQRFNLGITLMVNKVKDVIRGLIDGILSFIDTFIPGFKNMGWDIIEGLANGIKEAASTAYTAIKNVINGAIDAAKNALDSHSPSKVFMKIGRDTDEGYALGLEKYSGLVKESSENVADTAINTVSDAIASISDVVNDEIDTDPTIKPVLDLSDVTSGAQSINDMFDGTRSINLASDSSVDINRSILDKHNAATALDDLRNSLNGVSSGNTETINNTFNINGNNPKEIANEVSRIIQKQIERRDAVWA